MWSCYLILAYMNNMAYTSIHANKTNLHHYFLVVGRIPLCLHSIIYLIGFLLMDLYYFLWKEKERKEKKVKEMKRKRTRQEKEK